MFSSTLEYWTFPIPGTPCLLVTRPNSDGLLFLNSTASWIWEHRDNPNLDANYSQLFGISIPISRSETGSILASVASLSNSSPKFEKREPLLDGPFTVLSLRINEIDLRINFQSQCQMDELLPRLSSLEVDSLSEPDHVFHLVDLDNATQIYLDRKLLATEPLLTAARAIVLQELTRLSMPGRTFSAILHAGACGNTGECIILAGPSYSGKSTFCAALMARNLICYSDDSACLTPEFEVAGMPFALALRETPRFRPSNLQGISRCVKPVALLFVNYQKTSGSTSFDSLDPFEALIELQLSGFWIEHTQQDISAFLAWLSNTPRYKLTYSNLPEALDQVCEQFFPANN